MAGDGVQATEPAWPGVLRSKELQDKIKTAKVLCVGAGGIGCELLKTLVCSGFRNIEVIDLDTIETSNLNRQFLFRKHHVGQSKATTAAAVVQGVCPSARITSHHANVKEGRFDVDFFRSFDVVLNGLDNLEARRHVNRLCLAADRPLVESGTAGYLGQVTVHLKGRTECFECQPKPTPKTFPICTLRNTPDRPIHTIVWAKDLLFNRLFGRPDAVTDLDEQAQREEGQEQLKQHEGATGGNGEGAAAAASTVVAEDPSAFLRREGEDALFYACRIFRRVYEEDIERLRGVKELWEKRAPPKALHLGELLPAELESEAGAGAQQGTSPAPWADGVQGALSLGCVRRALQAAKEAVAAGGQPGSASRALGLNNASQKWTPSQDAAVLLLAIAMYHELRPEEVGSASFDKDDDLAVDFVTAASNLRSHCYGIPEQSLFDAKGMAGNIIHAIATTNAIISGLIVTEAMKILAGCTSACRNTFLYETPANKRQLVTCRPDPPARSCMVCGKAQLTLRINTQTTTLGSLLSGVIKKALAVNTPNLLAGDFMYEEGEGLEEDEVEAYSVLLPRPMAQLPGGGLPHGSILTVQDQAQHFGVDVIIVHQDDLKEEDAPGGFLLEGVLPTAQQQQEAAAGPTEQDQDTVPQPTRHTKVKETDDGVLVLDDDKDEAVQQQPKASRKRAQEEEAGEGATGMPGTEPSAKRHKAGGGVESDMDVILVDD